MEKPYRFDFARAARISTPLASCCRKALPRR